MKIAVPFENGNVFEHFGKAQQFKLYTVEDGRVVSTIVVSAEGQGHDAAASLLAKENVEAVICGGIGEGAQAALNAAGIKLVSGAKGSADAAVGDYLDGTLSGGGCTCSEENAEGCACGETCGEGSGCGGCCGRSEPTVTGKNAGKICVVHYRGTFNDGTQFDSSYDRGQPLEFGCGTGMMIRGFDAAVADMDPGQKLTVHLMPEEAYGMPNPQAVMVVPFTDLPDSEELQVGERVVLADEYGRRFPVHVTAKDEKTVTLDANHEMAGKELNFEIELIEVR